VTREELLAAVRVLLGLAREGEELELVLALFEALLDAWDAGRPVPEALKETAA